MNINFKKPINLDWALLQFSPKATGTVPHSYNSYIIYRCYLQVSMSYDIDTVRVSAPRGSQGPSNVFNIKVKLQVYSSDHISDCTLTYNILIIDVQTPFMYIYHILFRHWIVYIYLMQQCVHTQEQWMRKSYKVIRNGTCIVQSGNSMYYLLVSITCTYIITGIFIPLHACTEVS